MKKIIKSIEENFTKEELKEMIYYNDVMDLNEFIEENKNVDRNGEDFNIYLIELNKKLNKLK